MGNFDEQNWGISVSAVTEGKKAMTRLIDSIGTAVPSRLVEVARLGRTLTKRRDDVLAFFDHHRSSNGPTEAICESGGGWSGIGWSGWCWSC